MAESTVNLGMDVTASAPQPQEHLTTTTTQYVEDKQRIYLVTDGLKSKYTKRAPPPGIHPVLKDGAKTEKVANAVRLQAQGY